MNLFSAAFLRMAFLLIIVPSVIVPSEEAKIRVQPTEQDTKRVMDRLNLDPVSSENQLKASQKRVEQAKKYELKPVAFTIFTTKEQEDAFPALVKNDIEVKNGIVVGVNDDFGAVLTRGTIKEVTFDDSDPGKKRFSVFQVVNDGVYLYIAAHCKVSVTLEQAADTPSDQNEDKKIVNLALVIKKNIATDQIEKTCVVNASEYDVGNLLLGEPFGLNINASKVAEKKELSKFAWLKKKIQNTIEPQVKNRIEKTVLPVIRHEDDRLATMFYNYNFKSKLILIDTETLKPIRGRSYKSHNREPFLIQNIQTNNASFIVSGSMYPSILFTNLAHQDRFLNSAFTSVKESFLLAAFGNTVVYGTFFNDTSYQPYGDKYDEWKNGSVFTATFDPQNKKEPLTQKRELRFSDQNTKILIPLHGAPIMESRYRIYFKLQTMLFNDKKSLLVSHTFFKSSWGKEEGLRVPVEGKKDQFFHEKLYLLDLEKQSIQEIDLPFITEKTNISINKIGMIPSPDSKTVLRFIDGQLCSINSDGSVTKHTVTLPKDVYSKYVNPGRIVGSWKNNNTITILFGTMQQVMIHFEQKDDGTFEYKTK